MDWEKSVQYLKGVGPRKAALLQKLGIKTVYDLITYYPRDYSDRSKLKLIAQLQTQEIATIQASVLDYEIIPLRYGKKLLKIIIGDGTGQAALVCFNQYYLKDYLKKGLAVVINGKFEEANYKTKSGIRLRGEFTNFTYEILTGDHEDLIHTGRIVPIYSITKSLCMRFLRSLIRQTLSAYENLLFSCLPHALQTKYNLMDYQTALENIHFPSDFSNSQEARRRLVFEEFFIMEVALAFKKRQRETKAKGFSYQIKRNLLTPFKQTLPFDFTGEQKKAINEIFNDMQSTRPMNRLLQGEVGCGKTIVAVSAMLLAIENNYQTTLMAPTEILAEQHYFYLKNLVDKLGLRICLLIGSLKKSQKKTLKEKIIKGEIDIVVGTHALIQEQVQFKKLAIAVIDEQHKFGVIQRALLRRKGLNPDMLVMTATPIPRTLALTVYGDLDVSCIKELPLGRGEIKTLKLTENDAYTLVKNQVQQGRQAYIVYPLIEESKNFNFKAARAMAQKLQEEVFCEFRVGLLHGRLPSEEKEKIMRLFLQKEIDILVATTVIEVGIDVANASIMVIEHCERFGLASLHQLRGRIGRGQYSSYCVLVSQAKTPEAGRRIEVMLSTNDGFKIAEEDLALRGPGEFFGTRQHGLPELKIADILKDFDILQKAREEAVNLIKNDLYLNTPDNKLLKKAVFRNFGQRLGLVQVG